MSTKFSWLHFTDLHVGMSSSSYLWPNVEDQVLHDLEWVHKRTGPIHAVFFTGDLTQKGDAQEFQKFSEILDRIRKKLNGLGSNPVVLSVPGNHDLHRPPSNSGAVLALKSWNPEIRHIFWHDEKTDLRKPVRTAFQNWSDWSDKYPSGSKNFKRGLLPGDFAASISTAGKKIGVIGLNTAALQLSGGDYEGRLAVHPRQLECLCPNGLPQWLKEHDASFLLTHHPPHWLDKESQKDLRSEIAVPGNFVMHLCGHQHIPQQTLWSEGGSVEKITLIGRSLFGLEQWGEPPKTDRLHGYCAGTLNLADVRMTRVWPRASVERQSGKHAIDRDQKWDLEDDGGTCWSTLAPATHTDRQVENSASVTVRTRAFDYETVEGDVNDCFNADTISWYRQKFQANNSDRSKELSDTKFLEMLGLVLPQKGQLRPTVASLLLFGTETSVATRIHRPVAECYWLGRNFDAPQPERRWEDQRSFEGNIVQSWLQLLEWYMRHRNYPFVLDPETLERNQLPEYYSSFREAALNLLTHQDYQSSDRKASISFYNDRLVFANPGYAFDGPAVLLREGDKKLRNPLIAGTLRRIGLGESRGTGMREIFTDWVRGGQVPPEIHNNPEKNFFELHFLSEQLMTRQQLRFRSSLGVELTSEQAKAFALLCRTTSLSVFELAVALSVSHAAAEQVVQVLITQILVVQDENDSYSLAPHLRKRWQSESQNFGDKTIDGTELQQGQQGVTELQQMMDLTEVQRKILLACDKPQTQKALKLAAGFSVHTNIKKRHLQPLFDLGLLTLRPVDRRIALTKRGVELVAYLVKHE